MKKFLLSIIAFHLLCNIMQTESKSLQKMNISEGITVSGVSAGAFFAV